MRWRANHPRSGQPRFWGDEAWYEDEDFAAASLEFRWHLLLKEIVPNSLFKKWDKQLLLLPANYHAPQPIEEVTKDLLAYRRTRRFVNQRVYARCDALTSFGHRVSVGNCDPDGLSISGWIVDAVDDIGLGAARNPGI